MVLNSIFVQSALSPQTWPFSLKWLPPSAYLVGGGVRDALSGHEFKDLDLDFVLAEQPVETAKAIARHYQAGFVLLDAQRQIARVVFEQATADFALQVGPTLTSDLQRRDFTVNAIAYDPHQEKIIDPLQGCQDLKRRLLRMVSAQNLAEDPLRLLRAYRQAAQLDFELDPRTQQTIHRLAPLLEKVAAERVRVELSYLLSSPAGTPCLNAAYHDGLLDSWLPAATASGLGQIAAMDTAAQILVQQWPDLKDSLSRCISDRARGGEAARRTLLVTTKLVGLLAPDPPQAAADLKRLKFSRGEINLVTTLLQSLPQAQPLALAKISRQAQYFLFKSTGWAFPALAVLAVAQGAPVAAIAPLIHRYFDPEDPIAHPTPLLTGQDLIDRLHLRPGPQIGHLLRALETAQAKGKIATPEQAVVLARELASKND